MPCTCNIKTKLQPCTRFTYYPYPIFTRLECYTQVCYVTRTSSVANPAILRIPLSDVLSILYTCLDQLPEALWMPDFPCCLFRSHYYRVWRYNLRTTMTITLENSQSKPRDRVLSLSNVSECKTFTKIVDTCENVLKIHDLASSPLYWYVRL